MKLEDKKYILVLDLEMLCDNPPLAREAMEIIEIGIVVLNSNTLEEVNRISKVVKPINCVILSEYCKNLTHIGQEEIDTATDLVSTFNEILKELPPINDCVWCGWGNDSIWLQDELKAKGSSVEFFNKFINLKLRDGKRRGLSKALKANNIVQTLPAHRALADAISTADLARKYKISTGDVQVSNKRTYKEQTTAKQEEAINKLSSKCNVSLKAAKYILNNFNWDFSKCKHCIELIKDI